MPVTYHIITRGNNRATVFHDEKDYRSYMDILTDVRASHPFSIYHFALMPNHVHLILSPENDDLAPVMQRINQRYGKYYRERYDFVGHLWQGKYRCYEITTDEYLLTCGIYVELNPVRAGMVREPAEYRWSSHRFYVSTSEWDFLEPSENFLCMGKDFEERKEMYTELVKMWQEFPPTKQEARRYFRGGAEGFHPGMG